MKREWLGEFEVRRPEPSPGPWIVRRTTVPTAAGVREMVFVVLDANSRWVAECGSEVDAQWIAGHAPAEKPTASPTAPVTP